MIPTRIHGILDYLVGALLIAAPWLLGFAAGGAETWVPVAIGAGSILYSLLTDYELGLTGALPMRGHLLLDMMAGVFLALSPWVLNFDQRVYLPHLVVGLFMVLAGMATSRVPKAPALDHRHHPVPKAR
jgi:hypothetical protein